MSSTFILNIDSDDCLGTYQSFQYFLRHGQIKGYKGFYVKNAQITNIFYPFKSVDNKFYYYKKY